jgi:hypothetical protein
LRSRLAASSIVVSETIKQREREREKKRKKEREREREKKSESERKRKRERERDREVRERQRTLLQKKFRIRDKPMTVNVKSLNKIRHICTVTFLCLMLHD